MREHHGGDFSAGLTVLAAVGGACAAGTRRARTTPTRRSGARRGIGAGQLNAAGGIDTDSLRQRLRGRLRQPPGPEVQPRR